MRDERYVFVSDVKERKSAARSARNRRTHNGKGGRVILPHDHVTRKEWESMNGEVKTYKLNEPMSYADLPEEAVEETLGEAACDVEDEEAVVEQAEDSCEKTRIVPRSGSLEFEGSAAEVFAAAAALLGDRSFVIQITWVEQEG